MNTTLVTPAGPPAFYGADVSHLLIRHLTLMQHADATVQGVAVCSPGTSCQGSTTIITIVDGVPVTKSFPTMMVAVNQPTNLVQDPSAFASVANSGSFPACTSPATSCTVSGTLAAAGSACLSPAVINVTVTQSAAGWGATKVVGIVTPASGCTTYPTSTTPVASSFPGMTGTENPTFYVAYYPSPLSMWNVGNNTPDPGTGAAIRAFTNTTTPAKIVTATSGPASGVDPKEWWGFPTFTPGTTGITVPTPPSYNGVSGNYALWTITMDTALTGSTPDPAPEYIFSSSANMVCLHSDSGQAALFNDLNTGGSTPALGGYDINFDDMIWVNAARTTFKGLFGASVTNSTIRRDTATILGQAPCFSSGAGGLQIGQAGDPATYSNTVSGFVATATGDDPIASFNENGSAGTTLYPKSSIGGTTSIIDATDRSINMYNDPQMTSLTVTATTMTSCPPSNTVTSHVYTGHGSTGWLPVAISTSVTGTITSLGHCDPCQIQCPVTLTGVNNGVYY